MWDNYAVCGVRVELIILVMECSEMWKSLEIESNMMFLVPLICWEYMDTLLLLRVQTIHRATVS